MLKGMVIVVMRWRWICCSVLVLLLIPALTIYVNKLPHVVAQAQVAFQQPEPEPELEFPRKPDPVWEKAIALEQAALEVMAGFEGQYSVVIQDLTSGQRWDRNGADRYHPASTIKLPVSLYLLEQYRAGKIKWNQLITYTEEDFESPGGGAFETAPFGGQYPVENLANRALRYSNNVAVNMLGRYLGWDNIRAWSRSIDAELHRLPDGSPEVSALGEAGWWLHLHQLSHTDPASAELLLKPLREVSYNGRIAAGLPPTLPYLHKFGSYNGYYHDGGIIFTDQPYLLVIMTKAANEAIADQFISQLSAAVYRIMIQDTPREPAGAPALHNFKPILTFYRRKEIISAS